MTKWSFCDAIVILEMIPQKRQPYCPYLGFIK